MPVWPYEICVTLELILLGCALHLDIYLDIMYFALISHFISRPFSLLHYFIHKASATTVNNLNTTYVDKTSTIKSLYFVIYMLLVIPFLLLFC